MPLRNELPPRSGPWASRFDSEDALYQAEDALRAAALKNHDLSPILPFEAVYGPFLECAGKATAFAIDPTEIGLGELGLDAPGVDRRFVHFCAGSLGVEAVDDLGELRETFDEAWPDYRDVIRAGLLHLIRNRPLTVDQWYALTYVRFPDQRRLTAFLGQVYAYLFDGFDAMPVAPR
ncbi:hypothetical protein ACIHEI_07340 [Kitasatospora sp. NPDC051984]|uniref:hypothetical protein n=1 Tax=Kitasatospora sp. NPDC051984 TaxID=3364059 RepID=UPI0037CACC06